MNNNKAHNYEARTWMRRRCEQGFGVRTPGLKARRQSGSPIDLWDTLPQADRLDLLAAAQARPGYRALLHEAANNGVKEQMKKEASKRVSRPRVYKSPLMEPLLESGEFVTIEDAMKMTGFSRQFFITKEFTPSRVLTRNETYTRRQVLILRETVEKVAAESFTVLMATGKYVTTQGAADIFGTTKTTAIRHLCNCSMIASRMPGHGGHKRIWLYDRAEVEQAAADYHSRKTKKSPTP